MESDERSEISDRLQPSAPAESAPNSRRPAPHVRLPQDQGIQETSPPPHVAGTGAAAAQSLMQRKQDPDSEPAKDDSRCRMEALFKSKLGSEVLERQSYVELLQSVGATLESANVFLKEFPEGSSIRVQDFLELLFASRKEPESPANDDLRCRMEAMFKSKLKGSEWLPWQSCIDSLQSVGCTLQEAKSFLKEYGSWIRVKDLLDILFASPKEKQKLEDFMKMKKPISLCLPLRITFKLKEMPSVLSNMADKTFAGRIKPGAKYCYASYPGKFKTGFEALSSDVGEFGDESVACVYFCKKEDGLGSHHPDPEDSKGRCYCRRIYGEGNDSNRNYQTFGYIHWIGAPYGEKKMANAQKVADAMNAVLAREDASEEMKSHAIREAKRRWNESGRVAAWGCLWLHVWFNNMKEGVRLGQRLRVVYYPGMVGKGKVTMKDLQDPNVSLWDSDPKNRGLGGSQKAEVAIIDDMRKREGAAWDYEEVDVSDFLKDSFSPGDTVAALDGHDWKRGVIIGVDGLQWKVRCQRTNQVFTTDRVRHESEAVEKVATIFTEAFGASLPDGKVVATCPREERLEDGVLTMRFDLQCTDITALKALCSAVLSGDLDSAIKDTDAFSRLSAGAQIEKTEFVKAYKHVLMSSTKLTPHQEEKVRELEGDGDFHLSAAAGSGKTFVAVRKVLLTLDANSEGQVLFVAPTKFLCLHFLQWFVAMRGGHEADAVKQFARLRLMHAPYSNIMTASLKGTKIELAKDEGPAITFVLSVVDEAHDIFRTDVEQGVLREILLHSSKQRILLSDASQSSAFEQNYPEDIQFQEKHLSQVVRSTDRIVLGAKSFQLHSESFEQLPNDASSSSCTGPPLKTFIFEPEDAAVPPFQEYCQHTIFALRHVISSYPDLSLHHCVAIIVPNSAFLDGFKTLLEQVLQDELASKNVHLIDFEESLSHLVSSDKVEDSKEDSIILDSVDNAKGLEELIVISVGMDAKIGSEGSAVDLATRACLYQTITRAQLLALVVNEYVPGGWLEHLALCTLMDGEFDESLGRFESSTGAATQVVKEIQAKPLEKKIVEGKRGEPVKGTAVQVLKKNGAALEELAHVSTEPLLSVLETSAEKDVPFRASLVWDTGHNSIKTPIYELSFDPLRRSPTQAFEMLRKILPGEQLMAVPSTCPYPKNDCLLWRRYSAPSSYSFTDHLFLFCRDGNCLRRSKEYKSGDVNKYNTETSWQSSVGEGQFKLEALTLSGTLGQARQERKINENAYGFGDFDWESPWSRDRDRHFHYTAKEFRPDTGRKPTPFDLDFDTGRTRDPYFEKVFAELSEEKLKDLGMDPQHLWFWLADL